MSSNLRELILSSSTMAYSLGYGVNTLDNYISEKELLATDLYGNYAKCTVEEVQIDTSSTDIHTYMNMSNGSIIIDTNNMFHSGKVTAVASQRKMWLNINEQETHEQELRNLVAENLDRTPDGRPILKLEDSNIFMKLYKILPFYGFQVLHKAKTMELEIDYSRPSCFLETWLSNKPSRLDKSVLEWVTSGWLRTVEPLSEAVSQIKNTGVFHEGYKGVSWMTHLEVLKFDYKSNNSARFIKVKIPNNYLVDFGNSMM